MITTATTSIPILPIQETEDIETIRTNYNNVSLYQKSSHTTSYRQHKAFQTFKATSCFTVILFICLETVLLSTVSNCAKTFYMHWNTTNSM